MTKRYSRLTLAAFVLASLAQLLPAAGQATAATNLAVFNFQLKTGQEDWVWLEKFMSDQMATDLVQDRSLSVVARDRMQLMAQQMKWAPEFATTDAKVMGGIRSQLSIEYLVTGVCGVQGDQLEITAQIVEVQTRKEVHRKTVSGKTGQVIDLQKQLSADAMAWFTKKPAGEILKTLPMWTRSIPAVRALYEGMHLYDQGRYAEGWVKFRESSREDKNYVEAIYWVGKMYYFMYRYEHARRTLERFVYLNCLHPRMYDAITEYTHTFESTNASPDDLLALYKAFGERFADVILKNPSFVAVSAFTGADWAKFKSAQLLGRTGRHLEAAVITGPATDMDGVAHRPSMCILNLLDHYALTAALPTDDVIARTDWARVKRSMLHFAPGAQEEQQYRLPEPLTIIGRATKRKDKAATFYQNSCDFTVYLLGQSGYVFKSLRFKPIVEGIDATMAVSLRIVGLNLDIDDAAIIPVSEASSKGLVLQSLPRCGMLTARFSIRPKDEKASAVIITGVDVTATLEKVTSHGSLDVQCMDTCNFRVDVDGALGRWMPGIVGPLSPGEHTVTFRPTERYSPYGNWTTRVTVEPDRVTRVTGRLPWKATPPGASIVTAWIGRDYGEHVLCLDQPSSPPAIQMDGEAIRLVWSRGGDLWSSVSTDGNSFTSPRKLPLPVSTTWAESDPRLLRDESGRFVLTFRSDRDGQHRNLIYLTWSRDFVNWSTPALVSDRGCANYDFTQDSAGRLVCASIEFGTVKLLASRDGYKWDSLGGGPAGEQVQLLPLDGGGLELYVKRRLAKGGDPKEFRKLPVFGQVMRFVSADGQRWSAGEVVSEYVYDAEPDLLVAARGDRGPFVLTGTRGGIALETRIQMLSQASGRWASTGDVCGFMRGFGSAGFHARWGYVLAWMSGLGLEWFAHEDYGPYLMRSPQLPALLADAEKRMPAPVVSQPKAPIEGGMTLYDSEGRIVSVTLTSPETPEVSHPSTSRPSSPSKVGELKYASTAAGGPFGKGIDVAEAEKFAKPRPGCGTVNPNAVVVTTQQHGLNISIALDSFEPSAMQYDVLRLDVTGKGDFKNAPVVPRKSISHDASTGRTESYFAIGSLDLTVAGRIVPAAVDATYEEGDSKSLKVYFKSSAEGMCMFGDTPRLVHLYDTDSNLRMDDSILPSGKKGRDLVDVHFDQWSSASAYYGQPLMIKGELYDVRVSADGASVAAKRYDGPRGSLKINHPFWLMRLGNEGSKFTIYGGKDPVPLPPGKYEIYAYVEYSHGDPNMPRHVLYSRTDSLIDIPPGQTLSLNIGSPATGTLTAEVSGRTVTFDYKEKDAAGMNAKVEFRQEAEFNVYPTYYVKIVDGQSKPVARIDLGKTYGVNAAEWSVRKGLSGTFTATVETDSGPFITKPATATFTVK